MQYLQEVEVSQPDKQKICLGSTSGTQVYARQDRKLEVALSSEATIPDLPMMSASKQPVALRLGHKVT